MKRTALLSILLLATALPASAYKIWHGAYCDDWLPVPMYGKTGGSPDCTGNDEFQAMIRAGGTWNAVSCHPGNLMKIGGYVSVGEGQDRKMVSLFSYSGFQPGVLAVTIPETFTWCHGECDIIFNDNVNWYCGTGSVPYGKTDLQSVALHEQGHLLGLDHSDRFSAVMYAYYSGVRRVLTQDDINGICYLYGN